jgi:hypothetical protein
MDFNSTIDIIIRDLRELREIIDDFKNYHDVPQIQIELAKSKCKSTEEIIALLKNYKPDEIIKIPFEKGNQENEMSQVESSDGITVDDREKDSVSPEEKPADDAGNKPDPSARVKSPETKIIADSFNKASNTLLEQYGDKDKDDDLASVLKTRKVDDLSDAIGINDKFLFIREIFGGNKSSYEEALIKLNKAQTFPDAKAIILSYSDEGEENAVVKQLLGIVRRKLPSDG